MAVLHEAVKLQLANDATFSGLFPGGVFLSDDIDDDDDIDGGGWDWASENGLVEADELTIIAHAILRWGDSTPWQARWDVLEAEQESCELFMYVPFGQRTVLEQGVTASKKALNRKLIAADDRTIARAMFAFASKEIPAEEYQLTPSRFVRYAFYHQRG